MSSLTEMNEALRRQASYGLWAPAPAATTNATANRPRTGLIATLVRARKRRQTANLLRQLDSRLLDDIGITRGEIDQIAAKAAAEAVTGKGALALPGMGSLARLPAAILAGLTKAWRRQAAIVALQRLSNHTLADIGIERGRIAETIDAMLAEDTAATAAVRIQPAKPATSKPATSKPATSKPVEIAAPAQKVAA